MHLAEKFCGPSRTVRRPSRRNRTMRSSQYATCYEELRWGGKSEPLTRISDRTHRRYNKPKVNERYILAVANVTKSWTMKFPSPRNRDRGHSVYLYIGVRVTKCWAFSLSRSKANVHATMNRCPKRSTSGGLGGLYLRLWQTYRTHSRTTLKPSTPSGILAMSRFASDPSLWNGG